ncbi:MULTISPECIES: hypothetical protein [Nostocales]|uniref:hypothetical protein n=1 Tax=Nostocales TaxID=1161 RepID=UPI0005EAA553|nr:MULTISPECIES: hypothetical protein [Nostocales]BAY95052.1 hypothetical protein NIES3275_71090 [Microchaete diplosiphon NIES-3275]EKE98019.1 hypothetical protein FDUTEX481_04588 [Tolypothrix sp. PCC 7601]MBE9080616.1 hypothetical protein [Tolypothrix sp. LEGE 11397]UYD30423.1 hypothetical protein HGR01_36105 [Tolypothrix sp. PCC 7712]UYD38136.1 hypothetical protein HG267_37150 [Tolypothrix sp. PCC 7601]
MQKSYKVVEILPKQGLEPRQFLRYCFGIAELSPPELLEEETDSQYRKKCITVLCAVLGVQRPTVRKWGSDLNFDGIPNYCKASLAYIHAAEIIPNQLKSILTGEYNAPEVDAQTFLEKILLEGLTEQQILQTVSHANFRATCVKTLTQVLHIGTKSVQDWGQDMSFHKMPKIHKHTLGYALAAISKSSKAWDKQAA